MSDKLNLGISTMDTTEQIVKRLQEGWEYESRFWTGQYQTKLQELTFELAQIRIGYRMQYMIEDDWLTVPEYRAINIPIEKWARWDWLSTTISMFNGYLQAVTKYYERNLINRLEKITSVQNLPIKRGGWVVLIKLKNGFFDDLQPEVLKALCAELGRMTFDYLGPRSFTTDIEGVYLLHPYHKEMELRIYLK